MQTEGYVGDTEQTFDVGATLRAIETLIARALNGWGWPLFAIETLIGRALERAPQSSGEYMLFAEIGFRVEELRRLREKSVLAGRKRAAKEIARLAVYSTRPSAWLYQVARRVHPHPISKRWTPSGGFTL